MSADEEAWFSPFQVEGDRWYEENGRVPGTKSGL